MLILSLAEVSRAPVRIQAEIAPDDTLWAGSEITLEAPLSLDLEARTVGDGVLVRGEMATRVAGGCRRCLVPVPIDVRDTIDLLYEPLSAEEEEELGGEVYPLPPRGDGLDLGPAIREQLVLRVPEYVLCSESCRGLCPQCGAELNRTTCECAPAKAAGPWDALKKIEFD